MNFGGELDCFTPSLRFGDDGDVAFGSQESLEALTDDIVIVNKQHTYIWHRSNFWLLELV